MECGEKTGETTAVPQVPEPLEIKGSVITVDAMGTQRETARKTAANGGDCIPAVKGSQGRLEEEIHAACRRNSPVPDTTGVEKGHGRIETRRCEVFEKGQTADFENRREKLTAVIKITSIGEFGDKTETRERFYIGSLNPDNSFNRYIRDRRAEENNPHWRLDTVFREEEQRKRAGHAATNFATVRKIALNLLGKDMRKGPLKGKRLKAAWNRDYLIELLNY
jgi:predicted transposase YbfD/YdcC